MKKIATGTLMALTFALAGCNSPAGYANRSLDSIHQPVVSQSAHSFDVAAYSGSLPASEITRLDGWLEAIGVRYGDQIIVEDGSSYGSPNAVADIRKSLAKRGTVLAGVAGDASAAVGQGNLRVHVSRSAAIVPGCPDWSSRFQADPHNSTSSNYGCATNSNLAAMVADPNDLVRGVASSDQNTAHGVRAVKSYRERPLTGAGELRKNETSSGGGQ
jgi:pilus assembly protein CpaD